MEGEINAITDLVEDTNVRLSQQVLDENGQLADESVVAVTTTVVQNVTLGELKAQLADFDSRIDALDSYCNTQKTFLLAERQKISDQIDAIQ